MNKEINYAIAGTIDKEEMPEILKIWKLFLIGRRYRLMGLKGRYLSLGKKIKGVKYEQ